MQITEVSLENFKNHESTVFNFAPGINAICGPNGSGKTSILEAISWALFDYLPYKKDDIIKMTRSEKAYSAVPNRIASVQVSFISGLDEKLYTVSRNTRSQYYIYDNDTGERIAESKREIVPFLKKHYNLGISTNLEELFVNTVGVPQGMLTAIFFETAVNRKKIFDKVLNLEDYRKAFDELKNLKSYLGEQINELNIILASYSSDINKIPEYKEQIKILEDEIAENKSILNKLNIEIADITENVSKLEDLIRQIQVTKTSIDKTMISIKHLKQSYSETESSLKESKNAKKEQELLKPAYQEYIALKDKFNSLEHKKETLEKHKENLAEYEKQLQKISYELKNITEKLENIKTIKEEIKSLVSEANKEIELEKQQKELENDIKERNKIEVMVTSLNKELINYQTQLKEINEAIAELENLKDLAENYTDVQNLFMHLKEDISSIKSRLKENNNMAEQVKGGLCPFLNEECRNMVEGKSLDTYFKEIIQQLEIKLTEKSTQLKQVEKDLKTTEDAKNKYGQLSSIEKQKFNLSEKIKNIESDLNNNQKLLDETKDLPDKLNKITVELEKLGSPGKNIQLLKKQITCEDTLKLDAERFNKNNDEINSQLKRIQQAVNDLKFCPDEYSTIKKKLTDLEKSHQKFLILENVAKKEEYYKNQLDKLDTEIKSNDQILKNLGKTLVSLEKDFNEDHYTTLKKDLDNKRQNATILSTNNCSKEERLAETNNYLKHALEIQKKAEKDLNNLDRLTAITSFVDTSREILKSCAPQIGRFYIENISLEANQLFQDITGNHHQQLKWGLEYEILVEENGYERSFINCSGGEQMAAALSVRLALLKQLSDINIAFFDEPTTNMDEIRRTNLAQEIKNLSDFDQLIVISHDDTFEKDIDNVIRLE
jgi:exonuclease SbcC